MRLNTNYAEFIKSAADPSGFIRDGLPKIVFAGRSNAGKSSLINALMNRKKLARVSETPGKTIYVNYFFIDNKVYLVDLPGYGYAKVSAGREKDWDRLMEAFFSEKDELGVCVLIVDIRHRPTEDDRTMCDYLKHTGIPFFVAANKKDAIKRSEEAGAIDRISETLGVDKNIIVPISAKKKEGTDALLDTLLDTLNL